MSSTNHGDAVPSGTAPAPRNAARAEEAVADDQLQKDLARLRGEVEVYLQQDRVSTNAAALSIFNRAKAIYEDKAHHQVLGWARPLDLIDEMFQLGDEIRDLAAGVPTNDEQAGRLTKARDRYSLICDELGVPMPLNNPDHHRIRAIARAVASGADPSPGGMPSDWEHESLWLEEPAVFDVDYFVAQVIEGYFTGETPLREMCEDQRRVAALAVIFAIDRDRSAFEGFMIQAGVKEEALALSGNSATQRWLAIKERSPVRAWILCRNFLEDDTYPHDTDEWTFKCKGELDRAVKLLAETLLKLAERRTGWDLWIPKSLELLFEEPAIISDVRRKLLLLDIGFGASERQKNTLSQILQGNDEWPGRGVTIKFCNKVTRRLVPVSDWRERLDEVLGGGGPGPKPGSSGVF